MLFGQFKCKTRLFATWLITPKHDFLRLDRHRQNTIFCDLAIQELITRSIKMNIFPLTAATYDMNL